MPVLANAWYERFAQIVAKGKLTPTAAYRETLGVDARDADVNACRWMKKPPIVGRIEELKTETEAGCSLTREQFVEHLVKMLHGKPGEASLDNELCDSLISRGQRHAVYPMKAAIANQLAKICGWEKPTEVRLEAGTELSAFLGGLFTQGGTLGSNNGDGGNGERSSKETSSPAGIDRR